MILRIFTIFCIGYLIMVTFAWCLVDSPRSLAVAFAINLLAAYPAKVLLDVSAGKLAAKRLFDHRKGDQ